MRALTLAGTALVAACVMAGCSDKTKQDAREAGRETAEAARATGDVIASAAQDAVDKVQNASNGPSVKQAERTAKDAVNGAAEVAAAAAETTKVKGALVADKKVDASGIDVDTDAHARTITLKGHVPFADQKIAAGRIAAEKASTGYAVRNELVVK